MKTKEKDKIKESKCGKGKNNAKKKNKYGDIMSINPSFL